MPPNFGRAYTQQFETAYSDVARERKVPLVPFFFEGFAEPMRGECAHLALRCGGRGRERRDLDAVVAEKGEHRDTGQLDTARSNVLGAHLGNLGDVVLQSAR